MGYHYNFNIFVNLSIFFSFESVKSVIFISLLWTLFFCFFISLGFFFFGGGEVCVYLRCVIWFLNFHSTWKLFAIIFSLFFLPFSLPRDFGYLYIRLFEVDPYFTGALFIFFFYSLSHSLYFLFQSFILNYFCCNIFKFTNHIFCYV